jgi:hypothetical protein
MSIKARHVEEDLSLQGKVVPEKGVLEGENNIEGQRARVHQNHMFVEDTRQKIFHSGR